MYVTYTQEMTIFCVSGLIENFNDTGDIMWSLPFFF